MKRKLLCMVLVIATLVGSLLAGCAPAEKEPIKVGFITDLTGFLSALGIPLQQGFILAMEEAGYEVDGRPVEVIVEDEPSDPAIALDKARKLAETDKVCLVVGPMFAASVEAVAPYLSSITVPEIIPTLSATDEVFLTNDWVWGVNGTEGQASLAPGDYAAEVLGYKTATILFLDYVAGYIFFDTFKNSFEKGGGKIIQEQWVPMGTADFAPYIFQLEEADVFVPWLATAIVPAVKQFSDFGVRMPIVTPTSLELDDYRLAKEMGDYGVGIISADSYNWNLDDPINNKFLPAYKNRWGEIPTSPACHGYDSARLVLDVLQRTKGDTSPEAIAKALNETDLERVGGRLRFGDRHAGICTWIVYKNIKVGEEYVPEQLAYYTIEGKLVGDKLVHNIINKKVLK